MQHRGRQAARRAGCAAHPRPGARWSTRRAGDRLCSGAGPVLRSIRGRDARRAAGHQPHGPSAGRARTDDLRPALRRRPGASAAGRWQQRWRGDHSPGRRRGAGRDGRLGDDTDRRRPVGRRAIRRAARNRCPAGQAHGHRRQDARVAGQIGVRAARRAGRNAGGGRSRSRGGEVDPGSRRTLVRRVQLPPQRVRRHRPARGAQAEARPDHQRRPADAQRGSPPSGPSSARRASS